MNYYNKYLKYKIKYLNIKKLENNNIKNLESSIESITELYGGNIDGSPEDNQDDNPLGNINIDNEDDPDVPEDSLNQLDELDELDELEELEEPDNEEPYV